MLRNYLAAIMTLILLSFSFVAAQNNASSDEIRRLAAALPKVNEPGFGKQTFDIRNYGAKGDGLTLNTKAIGAAVEAAHKSGGTVLIPAGIWLTGPIELKSNVRLHLEKNAIVTFSRNRMENLLIQAEKGIYSEETEGITISNLTLLTKYANPLIDVRSSRQLTFDNLKYNPGADLLVNVSGGTKDDVRLLNTDVSKAKKDIQVAADEPTVMLNKN